MAKIAEDHLRKMAVDLAHNLDKEDAPLGWTRWEESFVMSFADKIELADWYVTPNIEAKIIEIWEKYYG